MTTAVAVVVGVLALAIGAAWVFQRSLVFLPDRTTPPPASSDVVDGARDVLLHTSDGLELTAWEVPADPACGVTALVLPGNGGNRADRAGLVRALAERGMGVLLVEYRGYGGNPGSPSESGLRRDARAALAHLRDGTTGSLLYVGESLGAAVATDLAAGEPPDGLLLRSPFTSLADAGRAAYGVPVGWLLRDRFDVRGAVVRVDAPLAVVYGDADHIVPPAQSREVADVAGSAGLDVTVSVVPGADHNDADLAQGQALIEAALGLARSAGAADCG
ncbi:conserved hypothetical protein [Beutenbergia cavernae DSM 12333]|uniref:Serine aminopeptidase S33 domain-containing protein n=1 Tax=Beutenbergia cavernae (strain ATCC BAA-8 / DSM 12333 / CCUG 43141 / JCM 11478 / NBRC 16432 / NCIMB 13614 / HKI 0122) TaxID=471853 RepID=C5C098_BEUC1|nr:alpha/beta hydrolase [Beutenbergia cavernae]ACQ79284.1 conserved hypothetical protein [Beutenbergia cavernae DSM 12333]